MQPPAGAEDSPAPLAAPPRAASLQCAWTPGIHLQRAREVDRGTRTDGDHQGRAATAHGARLRPHPAPTDAPRASPPARLGPGQGGARSQGARSREPIDRA